MWRLCVALLLLSSLQLSAAQGLVNLLLPSVTDMAPTRDTTFRSREYWQLYDGDKSTSAEVRPYQANGRFDRFEVRISPSRPYRLRPTHYRIVLPADLAPADTPTSWSVLIYDTNRDDTGTWVERKVTNAVFTNGVYEAALNIQTEVSRFYFRLLDDYRTRIAEIELLGPREALDALWPYGAYPCDQRLEVVTTTNGPDKVFSTGSANKVTPNQRRKVFRMSIWGESITGASFEFNGNKRVLVGAELPNGPMVQEVMMNASFPRRFGLNKVVLQGNFCQPKCDRFGNKGWVRLAVQKTKDWGEPDYDQDGVRLKIKNPDVYKAYRVKLIPIRNFSSAVTHMNDLMFLGCKA